VLAPNVGASCGDLRDKFSSERGRVYVPYDFGHAIGENVAGTSDTTRHLKRLLRPSHLRSDLGEGVHSDDAS
jgi:hypothetical protein